MICVEEGPAVFITGVWSKQIIREKEKKRESEIRVLVHETNVKRDACVNVGLRTIRKRGKKQQQLVLASVTGATSGRVAKVLL